MPSIDRGNAYAVLSSDWTGLSPHLIASFYPVRRVVDGAQIRWEREPNSVEVRAPITDGNLDQTANWTSPFENATADAKISALSSMLQAGGFDAIVNALQQAVTRDSTAATLVSAASDQLASVQGRTAVTKLNSTQIFSGMPPLKVTLTAHFRALRDSKAEVGEPMDQLFAWALPKKLATQGLVGNILAGAQQGAVRTMYPSEAPQIIGVQYADMLIMPLVIEGIPRPLTGQRDRDGRLISAQVTMTLGTLTAIDKDDWTGMRMP
jgi:hypothetical protein